MSYQKIFDHEVHSFIENEIDNAALRMKYNTQNVVYAFYKDPTTTSSEILEGFGSYAMPIAHYYQVYETVIIQMNYATSYGDSKAACIAHEILHLFGAPDLYIDYEYKNDNAYGYGIHYSFLQYLIDSGYNNHHLEIMIDCNTRTEYVIN